jgi:hypothetical protein
MAPRGRRRFADEIRLINAPFIGANIRGEGQCNGLNQGNLGELMGWSSAPTVCAAEGHCSAKQRWFARQPSSLHLMRRKESLAG